MFNAPFLWSMRARILHDPLCVSCTDLFYYTSAFYYDRQGVLLQVQSTNMFEGLKYLRQEGTRGSRCGMRKKCVAMKRKGCVGRMVLGLECWRVAV
jgi:hypothetical protein